jgi:hypothetical protein
MRTGGQLIDGITVASHAARFRHLIRVTIGVDARMAVEAVGKSVDGLLERCCDVMAVGAVQLLCLGGRQSWQAKGHHQDQEKRS